MLSLVGDYGGSSDDEAGVDVGTRSTASPRSTSATGAQPQAQPHAAPSTSASVWALPSASALLGSSSLNAGSGGLHAHVTLTASVGGPQRASPVTGSKRPASGQFPISDVVQKSSRAGQQKHVSAKAVNTLLPPQLRGRSNTATQDLEMLGFKSRSRPRDK